MFKIFLPLLCVLTAANVFAANHEATPPAKAETSLTYNELLPANLLGKWKQVASATGKNCDQVDDTKTDWSGIKNTDGSIRTLEFAYQTKKAPGANGTVKVLSVKASNIGNKNVSQGPYKTKAEEPHFSLWGYDTNIRSLRPDYTTFFSYKCRLVKGNANQLICGIKMNLRLNIYSASINECANQEAGIISLYERQ
jgi:hypothetical protein